MGFPSLATFPKDGLPNTDNLTVSISRCEQLQALHSRMRSLKSVQLRLTKCPSIAFFQENDIPANLTSLYLLDPNIYKSLAEWGFHKFISLRYLWIVGCPDAMSFPEDDVGMKLPTSLIELKISKFPKLKSSKGFQYLTSLESLKIIDRPNLTSLPDLPSSLMQLYIRRCPLLKQRCKRDEGQDWFKIAHIPCVKRDSKFIYDPYEEM